MPRLALVRIKEYPTYEAALSDGAVYYFNADVDTVTQIADLTAAIQAAGDAVSGESDLLQIWVKVVYVVPGLLGTRSTSALPLTDEVAAAIRDGHLTPVNI